MPGGQGQLSRSELETKSLRKSWRQVKSFALSHGRLIFSIRLTPCNNSKMMIMFSVTLGLFPSLFSRLVSCGSAMLITVVMIECANTASQFAGVMFSNASWNGANALLWYCSAVSIYVNAAGASLPLLLSASASLSAAVMVMVARCNAAIANTPSSRKSYSRAFCGMTICQA